MLGKFFEIVEVATLGYAHKRFAQGADLSRHHRHMPSRLVLFAPKSSEPSHGKSLAIMDSCSSGA